MKQKLRDRVYREVQNATTGMADLREALNENEPDTDNREECRQQLDLIIEHLEIARDRLKDDLTERPTS